MLEPSGSSGLSDEMMDKIKEMPRTWWTKRCFFFERSVTALAAFIDKK